ncbi:peptide deformylase 1 [Rubrobacter xylanophilus]|uniref:Peptide deformylase n=2 Tax=Rubrobacter xylanophilus TaxID=49319 RepID=A0A510HG44_9ACTN|nr:peptide deformylase 1 [Rubrobacter xylanophilus]
MALEMRTFGDPVLKSRAAPVEGFDGSLALLAEQMFETMHEHEGVGLAANQVGRLKRIFVAEVDDRRLVVVNPVIEEVSEETATAEEGCLSIPGVRVEVERPVAVVLTGQDLDGAPLRIEAEGLLARVVQHETDHLNGILILDRVDRETRRAALRQLRERMLGR